VVLQKIVLIGGGGFAREVMDVIQAINAVTPTFHACGYVVEEPYFRLGEMVNDLPVLGTLDWIRENTGVMAVCAIGAPEVRHRIVRLAEATGTAFATIRHPRAELSRWATVDQGSVVTAGCILGSQVRIGRHVLINPNCTVAHDATLDDFVTLAPGANISGNVSLHEGCYVGTGAKIVQHVTLGRWSVTGAGSTVIADVPPNSTVVGVPARIVKTRHEGWHF
jgi:sugar O-acyltransferase (sialic acid O-acetyltransferase NeuD family)